LSNDVAFLHVQLQISQSETMDAEQKQSDTQAFLLLSESAHVSEDCGTAAQD